MPDLSDSAMTAWLSKLPADIRSAVQEGDGQAADGGALSAVLSQSQPWQVPELVRSHADGVRGLGRARRIRVMAWMARATYPESAGVFRRLTGEDLAEGEVGGDGDVGVLFLEDLKALAAALAPRMVRKMASEATLDAVLQAATTLESDMEYTRGGV